MTKSERRWLTVIAIVVLAFLIWLLLRHSQTAQNIIKQNVPWLEPLIMPSDGLNTGPGSVYNIGTNSYVPADMPAIGASGNGKCDSMSPCIFCNIPNATYPTKPTSQVAAPYQTVMANMPATLTFGAQPGDYVQGSRTGLYLGGTPGGSIVTG